MKALFEPQSGSLTIQYAPDEDTRLFENPPRFTWIPAVPERADYVLQISASPDFADDRTETIGPLPYNLYVPDHAYEPGSYYWRYALAAAESEASWHENEAPLTTERQPDKGHPTQPHRDSEWSQTRCFNVPADLPQTPLPAREIRYAATSAAHPRLWLSADGLAEFRERLATDPGYAGWKRFYEGSVLPWLSRELVAEPAPYPGHRRVAALWRQMYMDCQEVLYAIRHLSVAGRILNDQQLLATAKRWLLHAAAWDPEGTTSRDYNDEAAFRIAGALAWGYDWLHDELTGTERQEVRGTLLRRTEQVAYHVMERSRIHQVPFDSHAVRSLSSVLVPCCLSLLHEEPQAREWLDYAVDYFACIYTPWGGADGGWAEGPMYWTTGMAYVIDALNLLHQYTGIALFERPFFRKTGDFPLYCNPPGTVRASFGDQSTLGEPASLKTGFNMRQFAGWTGDGRYQWYYEQIASTDTDPDSKFYNYGWWDFRFDELLYRHSYPESSAIVPVDGVVEPVKWFRDIGWVAMHRRMDEPGEHVMLMTKSSPYGSISHSHGDQNGFLLHAYGEPLAIESGHYVAFGSTMHREWRRQTCSTNNLLIDGQGQYAGTNKALCMAAAGQVIEAGMRGANGYCRSDATAAYQEQVPYLKRYMREIYFVRQSYFVIIDSVDLDQPGRVDWLLQTLRPLELSGQTFRLQGERAELDGRFVYCSSGELALSQHEGFQGVAPEELDGLDRHWHLRAVTSQRRSHRIATLLVPMKRDQKRYVSYFMDDQDHGVHLYFTDELGVTEHIEVPKVY
ncbi:DUF4962 domain-containing protein [Paenibacillus daejeonensis]|uniref:DUF4962 domain-containing protein n=1 Tax=Paenibacillus daejeonensis TaxID=135193 RepID=UPI00037DA8BF|nr:DUF4962 domain-containing protein [Paenibacillus daejeonensis]